jgi:hypothetical protein
MLDNVDDLELLRQEFRAEDGSFLLQLRVDLHWDRQAFSRLEQAMRRVCAQQEPWQQLDRWLVEGYWYLSDFVPGHTSHPDFPRPEPDPYYKAAVRRLWDLQNWFVTGDRPIGPAMSGQSYNPPADPGEPVRCRHFRPPVSPLVAAPH